MKFPVARRRIGTVLIGAAVLALGVSSAADAKRPNVSRDLITPGTLLVGSDIPYPPFEFGPVSKPRGFDMDLVNAMARKLRLKVEIEDTLFDTIFLDLSKGDFDLVASATTITPERKRFVRFTRPNYDPLQSLVVRNDSDIGSIRDLDGLEIGVQDGTNGEDFARRRTESSEIVGFPNGPAVISALKDGAVDAIILDQPVVNDAIAKGQRGFKTVKNLSVGERYGFAVAKSSKKLLRGTNWAFGKIRADGSFKRIYRKWFGINPPPSLRR